MAEIWNANLKYYNDFNNDLINVDNGTKTLTPKQNVKSSLKNIIDKTSEIIDRLSKIAEKSNEIIKKQKEQLNDEIVKSNNFKQWTLCVSRCATYCFKMISTLTKAMSNIVRDRNSTDSIRVIDIPGTLSYNYWKDYTKSVLDRNTTKGNGQLLWIKLSLPIKLNEILDPKLKKLLSILDYDVPSGWAGLDDDKIPLVDRLNSFSNIRNVCLIGYVYDKSTDKGNQTVTFIAEAIDKKIDEIIMDEKNNINNIEITSASPLKEYKDAKEVEVDLTKLTNETLEKCNEFYVRWVNKSDEKYQNWAWNAIADKNKDFDDFNYMIAYIPVDVKTGKWKRWTMCTPKNSLSDSVLESFFHGGKLERDSLSGGGKAFSKTIRKKK
jgi:sugar-specific transcriptional regulator TrmB